MNFVQRIDGPVAVKRAIISVYDKSGLDELVPALVRIVPDIRIYSTGGTYAAIERILGDDSPRNLTAVSEYTGQPEMQGGLVKTLDFKIYLGLLSETYNREHSADLERAGAAPIDMVVVNLYPFQRVSSGAEADLERSRANIDIGGPCMIRAAAKNFHRVAAVTDPADYSRVLGELDGSGGRLSVQTRFELAQKAFGHTAAYDAAVADYLAKRTAADIRSVYRIES